MITYYYSTARSRALSEIDGPKAGAWIHVVDPSAEELDQLAETLTLDRDILNDATDVYEAPRVEVSDGETYVFTRYCYPEGQDIATEPLLIIYTDNNIVTIMRTQHHVLDQVLNGHIEVLTTQKTKTFLHILEQINKSYRVQLTQVSKRILQTRARLRHAELSNVEFVSFLELEEDLNEFLTAMQPQALVLNALVSGKYMRLYEDDRDLVEDIMLNTDELIQVCKSRIRTVSNIRQAYDTIATNNLNKTFKRLTSIGIFLTIPMIAGGLWGMNVLVPFQESKYAFWIIVAGVTIATYFTVLVFKRRRWL